jgi:hypothetical protein
MRSSQPNRVGSTEGGSDKSTAMTITDVVTCLGLRKPASPWAKPSANSWLPPTCVCVHVCVCVCLPVHPEKAYALRVFERVGSEKKEQKV